MVLHVFAHDLIVLSFFCALLFSFPLSTPVSAVVNRHRACLLVAACMRHLSQGNQPRSPAKTVGNIY